MKTIVMNQNEDGKEYKFVKVRDVKPFESFGWHGGVYVKTEEVSLGDRDDERRIAMTIQSAQESEAYQKVTKPGDLTYFSPDVDVIKMESCISAAYYLKNEYGELLNAVGDLISDSVTESDDDPGRMKVIVMNQKGDQQEFESVLTYIRDVKQFECFGWHGGVFVKTEEVILNHLNDIRRNTMTVKASMDGLTKPGDLTYFTPEADVIKMESCIAAQSCWKDYDGGQEDEE